MRIGLLLPSAFMYSPVGEGKIFAPKDLFLSLGNGLRAKGHSVCYYSPYDGDETKSIQKGPIELLEKNPPLMKVRYVPNPRHDDSVRQQVRFEYELDLSAKAILDVKQGKIDLIHSFLEFSIHYLSLVSGIPVVYTIHDPLPPKNSLDYWRFCRFPNESYVAISHSQAKQLSALIGVSDIVHHGVDTSTVPFFAKSDDYLLSVGRYMPEKGFTDAIQGTIQSGSELYLAGSKEYEEMSYYKEHIEPYVDNVHISDIGFLSGDKKQKTFGKAKALLFPIHWEEPFGMVMVEAMAAGTPVIAYNRGSVPEVVVDGVTGFIIDPPEGDETPYPTGMQIIKKRGIEGLVEAMKRIGEIDRRACRKHVEEHFTIGKMVEGYEKVYKSLV